MTPFSVILYSGDFDRIHFGLLTATAAACIDRSVNIFVTMGACRAFSGDWQSLSLSSSAVRHCTTPTELNEHFRTQHIATFEELLEVVKDLSIRVIVCETGLRAENLTIDMLGCNLSVTAGGMVSFLQHAKGGEIVTF